MMKQVGTYYDESIDHIIDIIVHRQFEVLSFEFGILFHGHE